MVVVKFQYGNDVRRITLSDIIAYEEVLSLIERLFGDNALPREFNLKYADDEKDLIGLASDIELRDAISNLPEGKVLRIMIVDANPAPPPTGLATFNTSTLHNVLCRHCGCQIQGVRYVCVNCVADYSLCVACEAQRPHDPQHLFLKIHAPLPSDALARVLPLPNLYAPSPPAPTTAAAVDQRDHKEASEGKAQCPNWIRQRKSTDSVPRLGGRAACYSNGTADGLMTIGCRREQQAGANVVVNKLACRFVEDITVDDGHEVTPGSPFVKIWRLRNSGNTAWPEGVALSFVSGDCLSSFDSVPVISVPPGAEVDVSVDMVAPTLNNVGGMQEAGRYVSNWRLRSPSGVFFGHRVWADVTVINDNNNNNDKNEKNDQWEESVQKNEDDLGEESESEWGQVGRSKVHKITKVIRRSHSDDEDDDDVYEQENVDDEPRAQQPELQMVEASEIEEQHQVKEDEREEEEEGEGEVVGKDEGENTSEEVVEEKKEGKEKELPMQVGSGEEDGEWEVVQTEDKQEEEEEEEWAEEVATLMEMSLGDGETIRKALHQANGNLHLAAQALLGE